MQQFDIPIIRKTYELQQFLHEFQRTVPKPDRYTLWQRCENRSLEILEGFVRIGYLTQDARPQHLINVSANVNRLRLFVRLSFGVKAISQKKYILLQEKLDEIGRMLGGWIKSVKEKAPPGGSFIKDQISKKFRKTKNQKPKNTSRFQRPKLKVLGNSGRSQRREYHTQSCRSSAIR